MVINIAVPCNCYIISNVYTCPRNQVGSRIDECSITYGNISLLRLEYKITSDPPPISDRYSASFARNGKLKARQIRKNRAPPADMYLILICFQKCIQTIFSIPRKKFLITVCPLNDSAHDRTNYSYRDTHKVPMRIFPCNI